MNEQVAAFAAVTAIEEGSWDRYLLRRPRFMLDYNYAKHVCSHKEVMPNVS